MSVGVGKDFLDLIGEKSNTTPEGVGQDFLNEIENTVQTPGVPDSQDQTVPDSPIAQVKDIAKKGLDVLDQFSFGGQVALSPSKQFPEPQSTLGKVSRKAGEFLAPAAPGLPPGTGAAFGALTKAPRILSSVAKAGLASKAIKKQVGKASKVVKDSVPFFLEALSSVPERFIKHAAKKPKIFDKTFKVGDYRKLGNRAQEAVNFLAENEAILVNKEKDSLSKITKLFPVDPILEDLSKATKKKTTDRLQSSIPVNDLNSISVIENKLLEVATDPKKPGAKAIDLQNIKETIDTIVKFSDEGVKKLSVPGQTILKNTRFKINEMLRGASKSYAKANDQASKVIKINQRVAPKLRDANLQSSMRTIFNREDDFFKDALQALDSSAPKKLKFFDDLMDLSTIDKFSHNFPGQGGGSGSSQGMANFMRLSGLQSAFKVAGLTAVGGAALIPLISPKIQGKIIKKFATKGAKKSGKRLLKKSRAFESEIAKRIGVKTLIKGINEEEEN